MTAAAPRFAHVDSLRGLAALLVVWTHAAESLHNYVGDGLEFLGFLHTVPPLFALGRVGVIIFFCVSGFVICQSCENGARAFLVNRAFRLYPAYWLSLIAGVIIIWWMQGLAFDYRLPLANVPMIPRVFGQDFVIGLYWTLETELFFYGCVLVLSQLRISTNPWVLLGLTLVLGLLHSWLGTVLKENAQAAVAFPFWRKLPQFLSIMFYGGFLRVLHDRGLKSLGLAGQIGAILGFLVIALPLSKGIFILLSTGVYPRPLSSLATVLGVLIFILFTFRFPLRHPRLVWLGTISYSIYLFHPVVFTCFYPLIRSSQWPWFGSLPLAFYLFLTVVFTVALAHGVYYGLEKPCIEWGRKLSLKYRRTTG